MQVLFSQQPVGQLAGVHTQDWFRHSRPAGHAIHVAPPVPHAWLEFPGSHVLFWQQPLEQLVGVHTHEPLLHSVPAGHEMQAVPPVPHKVFEVPA